MSNIFENALTEGNKEILTRITTLEIRLLTCSTSPVWYNWRRATQVSARNYATMALPLVKWSASTLRTSDCRHWPHWFRPVMIQIRIPNRIANSNVFTRKPTHATRRPNPSRPR